MVFIWSDFPCTLFRVEEAQKAPTRMREHVGKISIIVGQQDRGIYGIYTLFPPEEAQKNSHQDEAGTRALGRSFLLSIIVRLEDRGIYGIYTVSTHWKRLRKQEHWEHHSYYQ